MSEADFNKVVNEFVEGQNKNIGKIVVAKVGGYPPQLEVGNYGNVFNEYITTDLIRHHCEGIGERNPLFRDLDYAKNTIWGGIIAPATFTDTIACSWPYAGRSPKQSEVKFRMGGNLAGARRELYKPIRPGDKFSVIDKYLGLDERKFREPRPYRLFIDTTQRSYTNQNGEAAAIVYCRQAVIATPMDAPQQPPTPRQRRRLTDEERDAINRGYDEETRRGAEVLYWEDVVVGEELKPLVVGPVTTWDVAAYFACLAGEPVAFALEWERFKLDLTSQMLDPEINAYKCGGEGHFADGLGMSIGATGGLGVAPGPLIDGVIGHSVHNWIGDYGWIKVLDTQYRNFPILQEVWHIKGKVTNKSTEGDEHLVDLELRCENQDGLILVPATATVRLPSQT